jgi:hypothetical protein
VTNHREQLLLCGHFPQYQADGRAQAPGDFPAGKEGDVLTVEFTMGSYTMMCHHSGGHGALRQRDSHGLPDLLRQHADLRGPFLMAAILHP